MYVVIISWRREDGLWPSTNRFSSALLFWGRACPVRTLKISPCTPGLSSSKPWPKRTRNIQTDCANHLRPRWIPGPIDRLSMKISAAWELRLCDKCQQSSRKWTPRWWSPFQFRVWQRLMKLQTFSWQCRSTFRVPRVQAFWFFWGC